ncbi:hypothetical protein AVEN_224367-1 [Araneus ventricosus]|uniref:Uncharacterized protein n=1 Tax=Araneus ventricosus TaxID=182803 RepID=A0A4Y2UG31_ARAVE|nr:hypothetical protein AVEN_224367-1 [Araneus ventricosus]
MENDALFTYIQERQNTCNRKKTAVAQFSNTSKQHITNNNSNSANKSTHRLAAGQLAMPTRHQRDSSSSESYRRVFIAFLTGHDITWKSLEKS